MTRDLQTQWLIPPIVGRSSTDLPSPMTRGLSRTSKDLPQPVLVPHPQPTHLGTWSVSCIWFAVCLATVSSSVHDKVYKLYFVTHLERNEGGGPSLINFKLCLFKRDS